MNRFGVAGFCLLVSIASASAQAQAPAGDLPPPLPPRQEAPKPQPAPGWFVDNNGKAEGPLAPGEIAARLASGALTGQSLVWRKGAAGWTRLRDEPDLAGLVNSAPPPPPLNARIEALLPGTWQQRQMQGAIVITNTIRFFPDGAYSGTQQTQFASGQAPPMTTPFAGQWKVEAMNEARFTLTLSPREGRPVTTTQNVVNPNTLRDDENGLVTTRVGR